MWFYMFISFFNNTQAYKRIAKKIMSETFEDWARYAQSCVFFLHVD